MKQMFSLSAVLTLLTGFSASAQTNFYTPGINAPTAPGLTNPYGSTVFVPNSYPHPLGGTPMPLDNNHGATSNSVIVPDSNNDSDAKDASQPKIVTGTSGNL